MLMSPFPSWMQISSSEQVEDCYQTLWAYKTILRSGIAVFYVPRALILLHSFSVMSCSIQTKDVSGHMPPGSRNAIHFAV